VILAQEIRQFMVNAVQYSIQDDLTKALRLSNKASTASSGNDPFV
jgi:hypothetical protein